MDKSVYKSIFRKNLFFSHVDNPLGGAGRNKAAKYDLSDFLYKIHKASAWQVEFLLFYLFCFVFFFGAAQILREAAKPPSMIIFILLHGYGQNILLIERIER